MITGIFSKVKAYIRGDATEDKVKTGLAGFNILHLATHGKMKGNIKESFSHWPQRPMARRMVNYSSGRYGDCS